MRLVFLFSFLLTLHNPTLKAQISGVTAPVQFSQRGGLYATPVNVGLSCTTPGALIRYTLDGSEPDIQSPLYYGLPLPVDSICVLRARSYAPGMSPSAVTTHTYFIGVSHTFPVVSMVFEPSDFFDTLTGIYVNYDEDLTAVANIEFFEPGADSAAFNLLVETEIQGTGSAGLPQKSLEIKAKNSVGGGDIEYSIFPELPFDEYKRFVLRNGGQDWCVLQFRDEFAASLLSDRSDLGDILKAPALYMQAWRPAVVYFNGCYWGIHNVRERMNRFYVRQHFDWDQDEFDMIENYGDVSSGDSVAWFQFYNYLWQTTSGFENDAAFKNIKEKIDYQNFIDYCVFNIYLENEDWPGNNVLRFRHRSAAGKWRWMTYDLDFTFGLYQQNGGWNTGDPSPNALARLLDGLTVLWPNPDWSTLLFRRCWQNAGFRRDFANRMADMLNTAFLPQRVSGRLDAFKSLYQPEIGRHYIRWWHDNYEMVWLQNIEKTRNFGNARPAFVHQEIMEAMPEAYGLAEITIDVFPPGGGRVAVNTVRPAAGQFPWTGTYFKGVPVPLKAVASPGYVFSGWSQSALGASDSVSIVPAGATQLVANFQLVDSSASAAFGVTSLQFNLYPNPANESIVVFGSFAQQDQLHAEIFNGLGQVLRSQRLNAADTNANIRLETGDLPAGPYFLKLTGKNGQSGMRHFVVEK